VGAQWGRLTALILPTANTEMMSLFLTHVAQEFSDGSSFSSSVII